MHPGAAILSTGPLNLASSIYTCGLPCPTRLGVLQSLEDSSSHGPSRGPSGGGPFPGEMSSHHALELEARLAAPAAPAEHSLRLQPCSQLTCINDRSGP
uniref:Uncharacterized protein n=1 Tax=Knipowitschia caucasica TaxID=637954 RepID=A0AAV2LEJ6_KNICA